MFSTLTGVEELDRLIFSYLNGKDLVNAFLIDRSSARFSRDQDSLWRIKVGQLLKGEIDCDSQKEIYVLLSVQVGRIDKAIVAASRGWNHVLCKLFSNVSPRKASAILHEDLFRKAIFYHHPSTVKLMIDRGANVRQMSSKIIDLAVGQKQTEIVGLLLNAGVSVANMDPSFLLRALRDGATEIVEMILDAGFPIDIKDGALLRNALIVKNEKMAEFLIKRGANVHIMENCALWLAASYGSLSIVQQLVDTGLDVTVPNSTKNALIEATKNGAFDVVQLLLRTGGPRYSDLVKKEALIVALEKGQTDIARLLIDAGAPTNSLIDSMVEFPELYSVTMKRTVELVLGGLGPPRHPPKEEDDDQW